MTRFPSTSLHQMFLKYPDAARIAQIRVATREGDLVTFEGSLSEGAAKAVADAVLGQLVKQWSVVSSDHAVQMRATIASLVAAIRIHDHLHGASPPLVEAMLAAEKKWLQDAVAEPAQRPEEES